ncbi:conjugal transfer protein TraB [Streptomyces sp. NPDC001941]|uniref:conjugal transfer protein TraB n=1 Tax=Streptomyces sp. NPDC001941 TaxID=3154659 RepID=UPI00332E5CC5
MSKPAPQSSTAAVTADDNNRYKALQHKLKTLATTMDMAGDELQTLLRNMRANADRAATLAAHIAHAELDKKFVEMTNQVSLALGGAAVEVRKLHEEAQEVTGLAHGAQRTHAQLYEGLDTIRSGRPERTPKPGFFVH